MWLVRTVGAEVMAESLDELTELHGRLLDAPARDPGPERSSLRSYVDKPKPEPLIKRPAGLIQFHALALAEAYAADAPTVEATTPTIVPIASAKESAS